MSRTVIVGGGVIGLSLAWELACRNGQNGSDREIVVIDRPSLTSRASWAGAGILLPANLQTAIHPIDQLEGISNRLHETWSKQLKSETGIDNGFRKCGGLYLARTPGEIALLAGTLEHWRQREIVFEPIDQAQLQERFPVLETLLGENGRLKSVFVPGEYQFRNPDHLKALIAACKNRGVKFHDCAGQTELETREDRVVAVKFESQTWTADQFCLTAGPWTSQLCASIGIDLPMQPVKGHMVLYKLDQQKFLPVINEGSRYLVPREDGHVLAGSTIQESDLDDSIVPDEIEGLKAWASSVLPALDESKVVNGWAGLRPGTFDGFPYMGRIPGMSNTWVSTGHFKAGLQLSTACAVAMADLLDGSKPDVDLISFAVSRVNDAFYSKSTENR